MVLCGDICITSCGFSEQAYDTYQCRNCLCRYHVLFHETVAENLVTSAFPADYAFANTGLSAYQLDFHFVYPKPGRISCVVCCASFLSRCTWMGC